MNSLDVANAFSGANNYKGHKNPDLRLVGVLFSIADGMGVPNDSPAKSIKDLKGLRMPTQFTAQSTIVILQDALLATAGLSHKDMKAFPVPDSIKGMLALGDGKVDTAMVALGQGGFAAGQCRACVSRWLAHFAYRRFAGGSGRDA
jgi:ABC-type nitrate/sulfonate/bicarbonate transport system substrate-binding protein